MLRFARSLAVSSVVVGAIMVATPLQAQRSGTSTTEARSSARTLPPALRPSRTLSDKSQSAPGDAMPVNAASPATPTAATPTRLGPAISTTTAGFRPDAAESDAAGAQGPQLPESGSRRKGAIFMIVGGAAMLGGAIIGDDAGAVIMIGGVLMTLYGLYTYLN